MDLEVTDVGLITVPLHFLIDFPADYPQSAPNIGFSFEFEYHGGAQYVMQNGRLFGKKVICLDILGNFGGIHTEWKNAVGSGWSPAYTVTTLLVQLQSVLCDLGSSMSQQERDLTYQSALQFAEQNPSSMLPVFDASEVSSLQAKKSFALKVSRAFGSDESLQRQIEAFAVSAGFACDPLKMEEYMNLLEAVCRSKGLNPISEMTVVDSNICCFATGKTYVDAMLGVGISRAQKNLSTAGEFLSLEAFQGGLRQNTNKSSFEFFLPVWINEQHAKKSSAWTNQLRNGYLKIGLDAYNCRDDDSSILEVFPRLINQLIIEMMSPDKPKSEAIATFEAMCNFWRTFRWLVDSRNTLQTHIGKLLTKFTSAESSRHKDVTPDLGVVLVLFTVFQGHSSCPTRQAFIDAYLDENSLRWVMWWQKSNTPPKADPVFSATKISREICMFQLMVVDVVIGEVGSTLQLIEETNCKLPDRLQHLQTKWREQKQSVDTWSKYFQQIQASRPNFTSVDVWIEDCVTRCMAKGNKYSASPNGAGGKGGYNGGKGGYNGGKGSYNGGRGK